MTMWHGEKGRKKTGGIIKIARKKRKHELGSLPTHTKIGEERRKKIRTKGGNRKIKAFFVQFANVLDPKTKTSKKVKIIDVVETPANPHFARRKIIVRGSIIKTEIGNAIVTSRPSQHGIVNAIALTNEEKKV
ncbi:MAG: 30S ribosomal protein S8e [Candidatus Aenigmatarchaeota archaeon]